MQPRTFPFLFAVLLAGAFMMVACAGETPTSPDTPSLKGGDTAGMASAKGTKVRICHRKGNGDFNLIEISASAEPAHRAHGDAAPGEEVPGQPGKVFDDDCDVVDAPPAEPFIEPTSGSALTVITITDPTGSIKLWLDLGVPLIMVATEVGEDPEAGAHFADTSVSPDGTTVTGTLPSIAAVGPNIVTIHPNDSGNAPVLSALLFEVT